MQRTIAISDIHGCVSELNELLIRMKYTPGRDRLILLGDYVDRGPNSCGTVERVMELVREGAIALRGNHDQRLIDLAVDGDEHTMHKFMTHGGMTTAASYLGETILLSDWIVGSDASLRKLQKLRERLNSNYADHVAFLKELPLYVEDERHLFVHAGIHPDYSHNWRKQPEHEFMYVKEPFWRNSTGLPQKVVFGHTRTVELHGRSSVWFSHDKIGIDGGCAYGQQLNGIEITSSGYAVWNVPANRHKS
ncbi:serine/threonine protein phosphatase 1 [Paenibacillus cellulosilyticus]|uniref:Serine/threonine protein phosphatase 1 n=1 Tax=Paenibacillus cellulosilyticus TaxID=375489 RepID=A0A2V2YEE2_9BACL|nr:metallophosphoesterase family protein [Paenibacillus cellulosilyticus]PWV90962.1 serine/threonine protein phosphatase 1 [Paenibacillus cellulosilyticus]QKS45180.1 serine/threonine protein phosphatase [Paenibacillus cellulosilyticus]